MRTLRALVLAALAFTAPADAPRSRTLTLLAALAIAVSGAIGVYHAGVELKIFEGFTTCTAHRHRRLTTAELLKQITHAPLVRCDEVQWSLPRHFDGRLERDPVARRRGADRCPDARATRAMSALAPRRPPRRPRRRCCASTRPANMARPASMPASSPCSAAIARKPS